MFKPCIDVAFVQLYTLLPKQMEKALGNEIFYNSVYALNQVIGQYRQTNYTMNDFIAENKSSNSLRYSIMLEGNTIAGFCKTETTRNNRVYLYSYLISPSYRGRMLANCSYNSAFLSCICESFRVRQYNRIELKVYEENQKAYNTYIHHNFYTTGKQDKRYTMERQLC
jgi:ribosomal protein S18 acetylase RimI-like enzyme